MEFILKDIEKALDAGLYFIALQSTLTLPDICGALESDNGKATGNTYRTWYSNNMNGKTILDEYNCYRFRCSLVHQAITQHEDLSFDRIIFFYPNNNLRVINCQFNNTAIIDVHQFCNAMINSVREWEATAKDTENFKKNYPSLIRVYPQGIQGISNAPVIG